MIGIFLAQIPCEPFSFAAVKVHDVEGVFIGPLRLCRRPLCAALRGCCWHRGPGFSICRRHLRGRVDYRRRDGRWPGAPRPDGTLAGGARYRAAGIAPGAGTHHARVDRPQRGG